MGATLLDTMDDRSSESNDSDGRDGIVVNSMSLGVLDDSCGEVDSDISVTTYITWKAVEAVTRRSTSPPKDIRMVP